jgi:hypothetical protein
MATSSITKTFIIRDRKVFEKLVKETQNLPGKSAADANSSSLKRGKEALKHFSFR